MKKLQKKNIPLIFTATYDIINDIRIQVFFCEGHFMSKNKLALVRISALPEIFVNVLKAKQMLASGEAKNASEATQKCNISRSAFYKYKDSVFLYNEQNVVNINALLLDESGILSEFFAVLYKYKANVLTVNQGIPCDNVAALTVSVRIDSEKHSVDDILNELQKLHGVVSVGRII